MPRKSWVIDRNLSSRIGKRYLTARAPTYKHVEGNRREPIAIIYTRPKVNWIGKIASASNDHHLAHRVSNRYVL